MKRAEPLSLFHRSNLTTLLTVTYTSIQRLGFTHKLLILLGICLVGIKSRAIAKLIYIHS